MKIIKNMLNNPDTNLQNKQKQKQNINGNINFKEINLPAY